MVLAEPFSFPPLDKGKYSPYYITALKFFIISFLKKNKGTDGYLESVLSAYSLFLNEVNNLNDFNSINNGEYYLLNLYIKIYSYIRLGETINLDNLFNGSNSLDFPDSTRNSINTYIANNGGNTSLTSLTIIPTTSDTINKATTSTTVSYSISLALTADGAGWIANVTLTSVPTLLNGAVVSVLNPNFPAPFTTTLSGGTQQGSVITLACGSGVGNFVATLSSSSFTTITSNTVTAA